MKTLLRVLFGCAFGALVGYALVSPRECRKPAPLPADLLILIDAHYDAVAHPGLGL